MSNALNTGQELRYVVKQVTGDSDKPLSMLCEQLGIRLTKDERKPSIQVTLRIECSSLVGNLNISMYEEQVNMQYPGEGTAWFQMLKRAMSDPICAGQELRYVVDMDKPKSMLCEQLGTRLKPDTRYLLGFMISRFQVLKRTMSDARHTGQELRYVVKGVMGDTDKPLSMLCEQLGTRLTDEAKPDTRYPLGFVISRFLGDPNRFINMWEEHILSPAEKAGQKDGRLVAHIIKNAKQFLTKNTACFHSTCWEGL